jgi:hypothetical protein
MGHDPDTATTSTTLRRGIVTVTERVYVHIETEYRCSECGMTSIISGELRNPESPRHAGHSGRFGKSCWVYELTSTGGVA